MMTTMTNLCCTPSRTPSLLTATINDKGAGTNYDGGDGDTTSDLDNDVIVDGTNDDNADADDDADDDDDDENDTWR